MNYIERYYHSEKELLDIRMVGERDINTFFSYLENLHSLSDRFISKHDIRLNKYPEFNLLRIIRNYFHHVDDVNELRVYSRLSQNFITSHNEHLIIPETIFLQAILNFLEKNKNSRKENFRETQLNSIYEISDCRYLIEHATECININFQLDGVIYTPGFDLFKCIYNISNHIMFECLQNKILLKLDIVQELKEEYQVKTNIPKREIGRLAGGKQHLLTTEGFIFYDQIYKVKC